MIYVLLQQYVNIVEMSVRRFYLIDIQPSSLNCFICPDRLLFFSGKTNLPHFAGWVVPKVSCLTNFFYSTGIHCISTCTVPLDVMVFLSLTGLWCGQPIADSLGWGRNPWQKDTYFIGSPSVAPWLQFDTQLSVVDFKG